MQFIASIQRWHDNNGHEGGRATQLHTLLNFAKYLCFGRARAGFFYRFDRKRNKI